MRTFITFSLLALVSACANLEKVNPFQAQRSALDIACALVSPDITDIKREHMVAEVQAKYDEDPSPENTLALAMTYAVPGQKQSSTRKALDLLDKLDTRKLSRQSELLADWLSAEVAYRDSLEHSNTNLATELATMKDALDRAQEKIEILTRIEQTIGPAPQYQRNTGGDKSETTSPQGASGR